MTDLPIIYEDDDLLVVNKPSGLITHPKNRFDHGESVSGWAVSRYPAMQDVHDDSTDADLRPGIVHRLDKETSGILVLAKTMDAYHYLKKHFQDRNMKKTYLALVHGHLKEKKGTIDMPIGKIGTLHSTRIHGKTDLKAKEAVTDYTVLKEYPDLSRPEQAEAGYSLVEVRPLTGRTHQIRLHMKAIGHLVVCDRFYRTKTSVCPPELGRLFLHAWKLTFTTPAGQALNLEADLPPELEGFLASLGRPEASLAEN